MGECRDLRTVEPELQDAIATPSPKGASLWKMGLYD
jgi:hypothetical protein